MILPPLRSSALSASLHLNSVRLDVGVWDFLGIWILVLGISICLHPCLSVSAAPARSPWLNSFGCGSAAVCSSVVKTFCVLCVLCDLCGFRFSFIRGCSTSSAPGCIRVCPPSTSASAQPPTHPASLTMAASACPEYLTVGGQHLRRSAH
jgi:hypothetical protein